MGLAYDTLKTFKYVLMTDRDKPEGERPAFVCRHLSAREYVRVEGLFEQSATLPTGEYVAKVKEGLRVVLVGWEHVSDADGKPVPFDIEQLDEHLTLADFVEFKDNLLHEMQLSALEKKRSAFAAQSTTGNSAK